MVKVEDLAVVKRLRLNRTKQKTRKKNHLEHPVAKEDELVQGPTVWGPFVGQLGCRGTRHELAIDRRRRLRGWGVHATKHMYARYWYKLTFILMILGASQAIRKSNQGFSRIGT